MWDREETERSSSSAAQSVTCLPGQGHRLFVPQPDLDRCRGENVSLEMSMATWHLCDIRVHDHFARHFFYCILQKV